MNEPTAELTVMTKAIQSAMIESEQFKKEVFNCFIRFTYSDWGDMTDSDKEQNDIALKSGKERIFARYDTSKGAIYIITEADRSLTTILFSTEY